MTLPYTATMKLTSSYHGLSNTLGLPYVYTATPSTTITERLVGDVVKSFKIVSSSNLNRKMPG